MAVAASVIVNLEANVARFTTNMEKAEKSLTGIRKSVDAMKKSVDTIQIAAIVNLVQQVLRAGNMIYDFSRSIATSVNDIEKQAQVLNMSTDEFQKWTYAAKMSDVEAESLAMGFKFLSRNMSDTAQGTGQAKNAFEAMGLSVKDISGGLKPLDVMMKEIMDKFAGWTDGPQKIAIALELFGRSGQLLIPLLNKGSKGFEEFAREAEKLGIVLDSKVIGAGSKAEDSFKKLESQINAIKLSLAPAALEFAKFFNDILQGVKQTAGVYTKYVVPWLEDWGARIKRLGELWMEFGEKIGVVPKAPELANIPKLPPGAPKPWTEKPKTVAPPLPGKPEKYIGTESKDVLATWEAIVKQNEDLWEIYQGQNEILYLSVDKIKEMDTSLALVVGEAEKLSEEGKMPSWEDAATQIKSQFIPNLIELDKAFAMVLTDAENLSDLGKMPDWREMIEEVPPAGFVKYKGQILPTKEFEEQVLQMEYVWKSFGENLSSVWSDNVSRMLDGTETFAEGFKNLIKGVADAFISAVTKMIVQWIIFGSVTGEKGSQGYGGLVGIIGSVVGGVASAYQEGGIINRPTFALVGEKGPEAIIPLKGGAIPIEMGGVGESIKSIPKFQEGGIVTKPTMGLIGENGPEAIIPLKHTSVSAKEGGLGGILDSISKFQYGGIVTKSTQSLIGERSPEAIVPLKRGSIPVQVNEFDGLINSISKFQEGDIITKPTKALLGESGPEAVIPLEHGAVPVEITSPIGKKRERGSKNKRLENIAENVQNTLNTFKENNIVTKETSSLIKNTLNNFEEKNITTKDIKDTSSLIVEKGLRAVVRLKHVSIPVEISSSMEGKELSKAFIPLKNESVPIKIISTVKESTNINEKTNEYYKERELKNLTETVDKTLNHFQEGGIITTPTPALIGEKGSEAVVPLKHKSIPVKIDSVTEKKSSGLERFIGGINNGLNHFKENSIVTNPIPKLIEEQSSEQKKSNKIISTEKEKVTNLLNSISKSQEENIVSKQTKESISKIGEEIISPLKSTPFGGKEITGLMGSIFKFQEGGIVSSPTHALIGERGPEAVIPLKHGSIPVEGGGGTTYNIYNIKALDVQSWSDFVKRNPGPLYREMKKDSRAGGPMSNL